MTRVSHSAFLNYLKFFYIHVQSCSQGQAKVYCLLGVCPIALWDGEVDIHCSYLLANQEIKRLFHDLLDTKPIDVPHGKILDIILL